MALLVIERRWIEDGRSGKRGHPGRTQLFICQVALNSEEQSRSCTVPSLGNMFACATRRGSPAGLGRRTKRRVRPRGNATEDRRARETTNNHVDLPPQTCSLLDIWDI